MNPAQLSSTVGGLFPPGVIAYELRGATDPTLLWPEEAEHLGRAVAKRVQEFTAGRLCARRALAELGIVDFPLRVEADRQPSWPASVVGSITHTAGFCAAVVAPRDRFYAVGLDTEVVGDVNPEIWPKICVASETAWIETLPVAQRASAVTLIFSAKEAFYKCQYPLTREWLNFHDLVVAPLSWGDDQARVSIQALRSIAFTARARLPMVGRYRFHDGVVSVGFWLASEALAQP